MGTRMNFIKRIHISSLLIFVLMACQPQTPGPVSSATVTNQPTVVPNTIAPTSTPEATPTLLEQDPGPFQFESVKMFDEGGTGEIGKTRGWAVVIMPDGNEYILHTEDGGKNWNRPVQTWGSYNSSRAPIFLSSQIAWNTNPDDILQQTLDGGQTWISILDFSNNPFRFENVDLHFWDADNGMAISGTPAAGTAFLTLSKTHDGGVGWERLNLSPPWKDSISDSGELLLCNL